MDGKNPVDALSLKSGRLQKPQTSQLGKYVNESNYIHMKEKVNRSSAWLQVVPSFLHCHTVNYTTGDGAQRHTVQAAHVLFFHFDLNKHIYHQDR